MKYRTNPVNGDKLSVLGYGCMRYTKKGTTFDVPKAEREMLCALENGVNYFDVAYTYRGCEKLLGDFLARENRRERVYIATKLPHYYIKTLGDADKYFEEQLRRLQTDYIDYYLFHMLTDVKTWERLVALGIKEWVAEKKKKGQIRNIGFSYHGGTQGFIDLIDAYPWDFTQIQFNYMDEHSQAGLKGLKYAAEKSLPVMIMEPLRGGRLTVDLPEKAKKVFDEAEPKSTPAAWGLNWIWNHPEVTVILSGMNDLAQVRENVALASEADANSMTKEALAVFEDVKKAIEKAEKIPCTGCHYCMPCPQGVDIPNVFRSYNIKCSDGWFSGMKTYFMTTTLRTKRTNAGLCVGCGKCKTHCPQSINVPEEVQKVAKEMEGLFYKAAAAFMKRFAKF